MRAVVGSGSRGLVGRSWTLGVLGRFLRSVFDGLRGVGRPRPRRRRFGLFCRTFLDGLWGVKVLEMGGFGKTCRLCNEVWRE